jgi:hypothetical protein
VKRSQLLGFTVVLLVLAAAAGCKSASSVAASAQFRAMNASAEQPSLAVLLSATTLVADLAYPTATAYTSEAPGGYTVHVQPAGTTTKLINQPVVFQPGTFYTFIAAQAGFASPTLTPIFLTDDHDSPGNGQIKLRLVHASPDLGNVDVYVLAPGTSIQNASPAISDLAFKSASSYQTLAPGRYEFFFTTAGTKTIVVDSGAVSFAGGQIRTVVVLDKTGGFTISTLADLN